MCTYTLPSSCSLEYVLISVIFGLILDIKNHMNMVLSRNANEVNIDNSVMKIHGELKV